MKFLWKWLVCWTFHNKCYASIEEMWHCTECYPCAIEPWEWIEDDLHL